MKIGYFLCSETVIVDLQSNRCSVINLQEDIAATHFPVIISRLYTVFTALHEPGDDDGQIDLNIVIECGSEQVADLPIKFVFPKDNPSITRHRQMGIVQNLVLPNPGLIRLSLKRGEQLLASYEFTLENLGHPEFEQPKPNSTVQNTKS